MQSIIKGILFTGLLGFFTVAVAEQLPPKVMVDKHLVRAQQLYDAGRYQEALSMMMDSIWEKRGNLTLISPDEFHFKYAQVALAADSTRIALESVTRYLSATGDGGQFYQEALTLMLKAEGHKTASFWNNIPWRGLEGLPGFILPLLTACLAIFGLTGRWWVRKERDPQGSYLKWICSNLTKSGWIVVVCIIVTAVISIWDVVETKEKAEEVDAIMDSTLDTAKNIKGTIDSVEANLPRHVGVIAGEIAGVKGSVDEVKNEVSNAKGSVDGVKNEVSNVKGSIDGVKNEVSNVKGSVDGVKNEVSNVKGSVDEVKNEVSNVKGEVGKVKQSVDSVKTVLDSILKILKESRQEGENG